MPSHHVPANGLVDWTAGTTSAAQDLLIACHLTVCPACRDAVDALDAVHAVFATRAPPGEVDEAALAAVLSRLDEPPPPEPPTCPVFPRPLVQAAGVFERVAWGRSVLGVRAARVPVGGPERVFLLDFPPGLRLPRHDHGGVERALVLRGGYRDEQDHFVQGDVSWRAAGGHDVTIDPGARCTTLFVNDGATDLGWLTPLFDWWVG